MYDYIPKTEHSTLMQMNVDNSSAKYWIKFAVAMAVYVIITVDITIKIIQICTYNLASVDFTLLTVLMLLYTITYFFNKTSELQIDIIRGIRDSILSIFSH